MIHFNNLYKINKTQLPLATSVLIDAFSEASAWDNIFSDKEKNNILTEIMVKFCYKYGSLLSISKQIEGVMAVVPHNKNMNVWTLLRSGAFFLSLKIANESKKFKILSDAIDDAKKDLQLKEYIHLLIMGVSRDHQGKGFGGKFITSLINQSEKSELPIYLETQKEENVTLYGKFGFTVKKEITLPNPLSLPMWLMVRDVK